MSPRTGRPKAEHPKDQHFSIRLDQEMGDRLDAYCAAHGFKRAEAIRKAILLLLEQK